MKSTHIEQSAENQQVETNLWNLQKKLHYRKAK